MSQDKSHHPAYLLSRALTDLPTYLYIQEMRQALEATKALAVEKDHMITELRSQLDSSRSRILVLEQEATAASSNSASAAQAQLQQQIMMMAEQAKAAAAAAAATTTTTAMTHEPSPVLQETTSFLSTMQVGR